jgi:hypothetical protein
LNSLQYCSTSEDRTLYREFLFELHRLQVGASLFGFFHAADMGQRRQPLILWVKLVVKYAGVEKLFNKSTIFWYISTPSPENQGGLAKNQAFFHCTCTGN